ncbi:YjzC family protein [Neobacillus mesonae]|uniref:YjzC family protein n=1 Tax=Neobacillus mesonae TaxID=1193713 RepID=UPI00203BADDB|nr:YjzC family protein [Neobacillus mesonae]MCM3568631.1 YjzC family protein [Neobacillus mesonae]
MTVIKSGETAKRSGLYVEVGHGGGKVKRALYAQVRQGDTLPELKPFTVTIEHKGDKKTRTRQHHWKLVK